MSYNELQRAKILPNYWLYRVFDVEESPKIVMLESPFSIEKIDKIDITPTNYFIQIKTD